MTQRSTRTAGSDRDAGLSTSIADDQRLPTGGTADDTASNGDLLLPYLAPYGAYVAIASLAGDLGRVTDYSLRIVATVALLAWFWKRYQPIGRPSRWPGSVAVGTVAGLVGVLLWIGLLMPFQDAGAGEAFTTPEFLLRLAAATLIVPVMEELLFRGYILGVVTQWQQARRSGVENSFGHALDRMSVQRIEPGAWSALAVVVSAVAFAAGHSPQQWLAATAYGLLMAALWIRRGDLVAPITAHAVTNLVLYVYVFQTGSWGLW